MWLLYMKIKWLIDTTYNKQQFMAEVVPDPQGGWGGAPI